MTTEKQIFTVQEAAEYLGTTTGTLNVWRFYREKLPFFKLGRAVRYRKADLDAYIAANMVQADNYAGAKA